MSVSIKNLSTGFAWVTLTRPDGSNLEHRIDPNCAMTIYGKFTSVVVSYYVPIGSPARPASGTWRIVSTPRVKDVLEPKGRWDVDPTINQTATIYVSDTIPPPPVTVTVTNTGPNGVTVVIKTSTGILIRVPLLLAIPVLIIPSGVPAWPVGATISEVIVEHNIGGRTIGTYKAIW